MKETQLSATTKLYCHSAANSNMWWLLLFDWRHHWHYQHQQTLLSGSYLQEADQHWPL